MIVWEMRCDRYLRLGRGFLPLLLILSVANLDGQSDLGKSSGVPEGPLLQAAPDFSQWTVSYSYAEDREPRPATSPGAPPEPTPDFVLDRPRMIVTTKTKRIVHELITNLRQQQHENWYLGAVQYRKDAGTLLWSEDRPDPHPNINYTPLPASGFRELDWISAATYAGKASQDGKDCLVFKTKGKVSSLDSALPMGKDFDKVAYIDAKSRLPVEVDIDKEVRTYQFSTTPPEDMQSLPEDLVKQIRAGEAGRAAMAEPAARPY